MREGFCLGKDPYSHHRCAEEEAQRPDGGVPRPSAASTRRISVHVAPDGPSKAFELDAVRLLQVQLTGLHYESYRHLSH